MSMNSVSSNNTMAPLVVKKHLGGLQGTQVQSLVREVPPAVRCGQRKRKKERKKKIKFANLKKKYKCCFFVSSASSGGLYSLCVEFCSPFSPLQSSSSQLLYPTSCYLPLCLLLYLSPAMTSVAITLDSPSSSKRVS